MRWNNRVEEMTGINSEQAAGKVWACGSHDCVGML